MFLQVVLPESVTYILVPFGLLPPYTSVLLSVFDTFWFFCCLS